MLGASCFRSIVVVERLDALAAIGMRVCALQTIDAIVVVERMDTLAPIGMCVCFAGNRCYRSIMIAHAQCKDAMRCADK